MTEPSLFKVMKKSSTMILSGILLAGLVSCNKQEAGAVREELPSQSAEIEFCLASDAAIQMDTKSATMATEGAINNFQILVFNSDGKIDGYGSTTSSTATVKVTRGASKQCYAVVNSSEDLSTIATKSALLAKVSYLKNNSLSGLEMVGSVTKDLSSASSCEIPVTRFAAKVVIDKITPAFTNAAHSAMEFKVVAIYLTNVNGQSTYDMATNTLKWYNQLKYVSGECNALLADMSINKTITAAAPLNEKHYFYCYANPSSQTTEGGASFSARQTRLVIETTLGGTTYYYPINIASASGTLNYNTAYEITNLKITGLGSDNPDVTPKKGSISFTVKVTDWATGFSKEVEY